MMKQPEGTMGVSGGGLPPSDMEEAIDFGLELVREGMDPWMEEHIYGEDVNKHMRLEDLLG